MRVVIDHRGLDEALSSDDPAYSRAQDKLLAAVSQEFGSRPDPPTRGVNRRPGTRRRMEVYHNSLRIKDTGEGACKPGTLFTQYRMQA